MKTFSLTFITILLSTFAFAQNETITGIITDDNNQPIERACVLVLDADDHSYITGTVTDENGNYEINLMQEGRNFPFNSRSYQFRRAKRNRHLKQ